MEFELDSPIPLFESITVTLPAYRLLTGSKWSKVLAASCTGSIFWCVIWHRTHLKSTSVKALLRKQITTMFPDIKSCTVCPRGTFVSICLKNAYFTFSRNVSEPPKPLLTTAIHKASSNIVSLYPSPIFNNFHSLRFFLILFLTLIAEVSSNWRLECKRKLKNRKDADPKSLRETWVMYSPDQPDKLTQWITAIYK